MNSGVVSKAKRPFLPDFAVGVHLDKRSVTWQVVVEARPLEGLTPRLHPDQSGFETWREP